MRLAYLLVSATLLSSLSFYAVGQNNQGLKFVQNKGQWEENVDFQASVPGGRLAVSANGFSILLLDQEEMEHQHLATHSGINESDGQSDPIDAHYFQINLLGSNLLSKPVVGTPLDGYYNYFLGIDSCRWATNALAYTSIVYPEVYAGIDFRVSSIGNNLKYDFIVKPGADPSQVKIDYCGTFGVEKVEDDLKINTSIGQLTEQKPYTYYLDDYAQVAVPSQYQLQNNTVSFDFPEDYDACRTLIIDPLLIFSTYSGSTADNWGSTATPGEHGTLYSAGVTRQDFGSFPATTGAFQTTNRGSFDMAIIKYDSLGTKFLYATHLGGTNNDSPQSLVVDKVSGDLLILGISSSVDFPTSASAFDNTFNFGLPTKSYVLNTTDGWDIVVTRLSSMGNVLIGSTFLGGSGNDGFNTPKQSGGPLVANYGDEMRGDIITDETGNVYISSVTGSNNFPVVNGFDNTFNGVTDGVVIKLGPDLSSITWSTYLGGSAFDAAYSIKLDGDKNLILAGGTNSINFPATADAYQPTLKGIVDGWIARISADGNAVMNATFTGTTSFDQVYFIDLNSTGNIFCYGQTTGKMPVTPGVYNNPNSGQFIQEFSADLRTLEMSTVFGSGSPSGIVIPNISPTAFMVNDCDNIYMAGWGGYINAQFGFWQSSSNNMPITSDAYQKTTSGSDFYFMVLNGDATKLVYSTYFGGNSSKTHVDGGTSRFDKYGIVYHAVCSGCTAGNTTGLSSSDFPTTPNAKSRLNLSKNCNNAAFKFDLTTLVASFETNNTALTKPGYNNVCYPEQIVFQNKSVGGRSIEWDFDDGTIVNQINTDPKNVTHAYAAAGQYHVKLTITDLSTCSQTASIVKVINYFKETIQIGADDMICQGTSFQLSATGGATYNWRSEDGKFTSLLQSPIVQPDKPTTYFVAVVDANGCKKEGSQKVGIKENLLARFQTYNVQWGNAGLSNVCHPDFIRFKNLSKFGEYFVWDFNDGSVPLKTSDTVSVIYKFKNPGTYNVTLTATSDKTCNGSDSDTKPINYFKPNIKAGIDGKICEGTSFQLVASGANVYKWSADDPDFKSSNQSPLVEPVKTTQYFLTATDINGCVGKDTILVDVVDRMEVNWQYNLEGTCEDRPYVQVKNLAQPADDVFFTFDFGDGTTSSETDVQHVYENDGSYSLKFITKKDLCYFEETVQLQVYSLLVPNVLTPEASPGYNDYFQIGFGSNGVAPADVGLPVQLKVVDRWGRRVFESSDYKNDWNGQNLSGGVYYVHLTVGDLVTCKNWLHILK